MMDYSNSIIARKEHEERVRKLQHERLARSVNSQGPGVVQRLLVWIGGRLIYVGGQLQERSSSQLINERPADVPTG